MLLNSIFKSAPNIDIKQLSCDSRIPMKDCIFFCLKGIKYDGHNYVDEAIRNGATVIIYSDNIDTNLKAIYIKVSNVLNYLIKISNIFYDNPQDKIYSFLIAGTYGRSTISSIINDLLKNYKNCGYIGVYGINYNETNLYSVQPTLNILDTQKYLNDFVNSGVEAVTLEANNLSFEYKKLDFIKPNVFIYTNTSKDKVNKNDEYILTIQRYLYTLDKKTKVILNRDDISFEQLCNAVDSYITYGQNEESNYLITNIEATIDHTSFSIVNNGKETRFTSKLIGLNNLYNSVASLVALDISGYSLSDLSLLFNFIDQRDGIYQKIDNNNYNIFVDAAYYKESYESILKFFKKTSKKRLISLISVSATDERSRIAFLMKIASDYSDQIIVTEDIVYDYDINDTFKLCDSYLTDTPCLFIEDRQTAIETGIDLLNKDDTLLILGKGNENYMYKGLIKQNYDGDVNIASRYLNKINNENKMYEE